MAVVNLKEFNAKLKAFTKSVPEQFINVAHKKLSLDILSGVTKRTPVASGRARLNWQLSIGSPASGIKEVGKSEGEMSSSLVPSLQEVGQEVINEGMNQLQSLNPFGIVFISNNVNYVGYLDQGSSKQAPAGMVAQTLQEVGGTI